MRDRRAYYIKNKQKICAYALKWQKQNKDKFKESQRRYRRRVKEDAILKYGGQCVGCSCRDINVLTFDHINGKGTKRRNAGLDKRGDAFYLQLLKTKKRSGLQVLCGNCQMRKRVLGNDIEKWFSRKFLLRKQ